MAGDRALLAMSTMMRNAKRGSCSIVRSGPMATQARKAPASTGRPPRRTRNSGSPRATKSPTCGTSSITTSARSAIATRSRWPNASTTPELPTCSTTDASRFRRRQTSPVALRRDQMARDRRSPPRRALPRPRLEHRNRPQRSAEPLREPEEEGDAHQVADDGKRDRQLRRRVVDSARGRRWCTCRQR